MICARCLWRASPLRPSPLIPRFLSSSAHLLEPLATAISTSAAQPPSTHLSSTPKPVSLGVNLRPASKSTPIEAAVSSVAAGTPLKGINYLKNQNDPVALPENEYPEWLWRCLDVKKKDDGDEAMDADLFGKPFSYNADYVTDLVVAKSKKLRRKAAKRQRKAEAARLASGDLSLLDPKVPLTQQSIDLPSNPDGTFDGALEAAGKRKELKSAMRSERRAKIKEKNYLKSV